MLRAGGEKLLGGREHPRRISRFFQQALQGSAHQLVVVDDGDQPRVPGSHARSIPAGDSGPQSSLGFMWFVFLMTRPRWNCRNRRA
jgi:hypothetical protein